MVNLEEYVDRMEKVTNTADKNLQEKMQVTNNP